MAGRAVTTTRESRVTMKKAAEVRSSAQPVLVGCLGAMAAVGGIDCLFASGYSGCSPGTGSDPYRARYLSPLPTARGPLDCAGELAHRAGESFGFPGHPRSAGGPWSVHEGPKADERAEATGQKTYKGRERTKVPAMLTTARPS